MRSRCLRLFERHSSLGYSKVEVIITYLSFGKAGKAIRFLKKVDAEYRLLFDIGVERNLASDFLTYTIVLVSRGDYPCGLVPRTHTLPVSTVLTAIASHDKSYLSNCIDLAVTIDVFSRHGLCSQVLD